jgi:hypothetical protein
MNMHRTLAVAGVLTTTALLLPAAISSSASSSSRSDARVALLERAAGPADALPPAVAKLIDAKEVDLSSTRLAGTRGTLQFFVAQGARGVCLIRVDDPRAPIYSATCASTLAAGGVYLASLDRAKGTMQLADVVPDDVTHASVEGTRIGAENNLVVTGEIAIGSAVDVVGPAGSERVPVAASASAIPTG